MDQEARVTLRIPDPDEFEDDEPFVYVPVPAGVVDSGIDLLHCVLGQWKKEVGCASDDEVWDPLMVSAAQMLSALFGAWTEHYSGGGARALVDQIAWFCHWKEARSRLEALQPSSPQPHPAFETGLEDADVVAALLPLTELSARRRKEARKQQAAVAQAPATERDGWDF